MNGSDFCIHPTNFQLDIVQRVPGYYKYSKWSSLMKYSCAAGSKVPVQQRYLSCISGTTNVFTCIPVNELFLDWRTYSLYDSVKKNFHSSVGGSQRNWGPSHSPGVTSICWLLWFYSKKYFLLKMYYLKFFYLLLFFPILVLSGQWFCFIASVKICSFTSCLTFGKLRQALQSWRGMNWIIFSS